MGTKLLCYVDVLRGVGWCVLVLFLLLVILVVYLWLLIWFLFDVVPWVFGV